jgi:hypothetical protein
MGLFKINGRKSADTRVSSWSDARVKLFKTMYFLKEFKCPLLPTILKLAYGSEFSQSEYHSMRTMFRITSLQSAEDLYISQTAIVDVQDLLVKYIDLVCLRLEKIAGNNIDRTDSDPITDRTISKVIGIRRRQITRNGVHHLICSEQDIRKIESCVSHFRDIKRKLTEKIQTTPTQNFEPQQTRKEKQND